MTIDKKIIDELIKEYKNPEEIIGENGILKQLTKALIERAMEVEMSHHLGYEKHSVAGNNSGNSRNGISKKTITGDYGNLDISIPRDRNSSFEPQMIKKGQTRFTGFDDKIISMYALGMSTRNIQSHLKDIYGVDVSSTLVSEVTDEILNEVKTWQNRSLDPLYAVIYLDALVVKCRYNGQIENQAVYLAIGINMEGKKEILGMWMSKTEGAKFWLGILTEIKNRGVKDCFIFSVDGLKGFPDAIEAVFPQSQVQLCIVHMVRSSLKFVSWKERKEVAADLKEIYQAISEDDARFALESFSKKWDKKYPTISKSWRSNWERLNTIFEYPAEIRKAIYTTNIIESLNNSLRRVIKTRGSFPNEEAAMKLLYMALNNATKKWTLPIHNWKMALNFFAIKFEDRMNLYV